MSDGVLQLLSVLLTEMQAVVELHSHPELLEEAARSYFILCRAETPWHPIAGPDRDALVQRWTDRLAALLGKSLQVGIDGMSTHSGWSALAEVQGEPCLLCSSLG